MRSSLPLLLITLISTVACKSRPPADLLVFNAKIYTVDSTFSVQEAMVIDKGKVVETGTLSALRARYTFRDSLNANQQYIYPGFNDAHALFVGFGVCVGWG